MQLKIWKAAAVIIDAGWLGSPERLDHGTLVDRSSRQRRRMDKEIWEGFIKRDK